MKKILLTLAFLGTLSFYANAQLNFGAAATYSNYGGEIKKATPGIQIHGAYYLRDKTAIGLGFSYNLPIKQTVTDGTFSYDQTTSFMALNLFGIFNIIGTYEDDFSLYVPIGASYVIGNSKYKIVGTLPSGAIASEDEKLSGLTINASIGMQYRIGNPYVFVEAGFAAAANNSTNSRTGTTGTNPVPSHTIIQVGVRLPIGNSVY